jgi:hypothetical protein
MSVRRLASASAVACLVVLAGITAGAHFGNPLTRVAGVPSAPDHSEQGKPPGTVCSDITDQHLDKFLTAKRVTRETMQREQDAASARMAAAKAQLDAGGQQRAAVMMNTMMENEACKDPIKEKDPRAKEVQRLYALAEAASGGGDDAKAEEYQNKASQLESAIDIDADRKCGGKGSSALHDCIEKKKPVLAKQGVAEPMLTVQTQAECMQDPSTMGLAGMTGESAEEQAAKAAQSEAQDALRNAQGRADKAGADASGLSTQELGRIADCICLGRGWAGPNAVTSPEAQAAVNRRKAELTRAAGCS